MTERLEFTVVDAFTGAAFGGNPAAIVVLRKDHGLPDRFLQLFAREMALSETAYTVGPVSCVPARPVRSIWHRLCCWSERGR